jgi:hypothetical protein
MGEGWCGKEVKRVQRGFPVADLIDYETARSIQRNEGAFAFDLAGGGE